MIAAQGAEGGISALHALEVFGAAVLVVTLALLATSRRLYRFQRIAPIGAIITGGWLAIFLGFILGPNILHVIDGDLLLEVRPLLMIGLGWVGVIVGMQARRDVTRFIPAVLWRWSIFDAILCVALGVSVSVLVLSMWLPTHNHTAAWMLNAVVVLTACMIGWAPETRSIRVYRTPKANRLAILVQSGAGISAIIAITLYGLSHSLVNRDAAGNMVFHIPTTIIVLLVTLAVAVLLGFGGRFMLRQADRSRPDMLAVFLGIVALTAGVAADLRLSPLFGSMLTGMIIANLAGQRLRDFERFILKAEHSVALIFFLLAGVLLEPLIGWWGIILVIALLVIRLNVKPLVMSKTLAIHSDELPLRSALYTASTRQSPIAIAIGVGLVLSESSMFHRQLLSIIVLTGVCSEMLPLILSLILKRKAEQDLIDAPDEFAAGSES